MKPIIVVITTVEICSRRRPMGEDLEKSCNIITSIVFNCKSKNYGWLVHGWYWCRGPLCLALVRLISKIKIE